MSEYELKIESEIGGGSLSLFRDGQFVGAREGSADDKKKDFYIENISEFLSENNVGLNETAKITYSNFPGSQTGLKIIAAIVKGLSVSHHIENESKNLFESLSKYFTKTASDFEKTSIILPLNRKEFLLEIYDGINKTGSVRIVQTDLESEIKKLIRENLKIILPVKFLQDAVSAFPGFEDTDKIIDTGKNLSVYL